MNVLDSILFYLFIHLYLILCKNVKLSICYETVDFLPSTQAMLTGGR